MEVRQLSIAGAWEFTPQKFGDSRGVFLEWFKATSVTEALGHPFELAQANLSVSAAGVLRGIHFADVPPGQAKMVTCVAGAVLDVVVDLRVGSETFGTWDSVLLDDVTRRAVYLQEGLGHAFLSLEDGSTVTYLCSAPYAPGREHGVHPLDAELRIEWPTLDRSGAPLTLELSDKDRDAPTLAQARASGLLPQFEETSAFVAALRGEQRE